MDLFHGRRRLFLYCVSLSVLLALLLFSLGAIARTGAFLTGKGDWQGLAGEYRIGVIDYVVEINDQDLGIANGYGKTNRLAVPLLGGVRMFDSTVSTDLRSKEFNEGVTLVRIRVVNHSDSMVNVTASFQVNNTQGIGAIRFLPLPAELNADSVRTLNYRKSALSALTPYGFIDPGATHGSLAKEKSALQSLDNAYAAYVTAHPTMELPVGILSGAVTAGTGTGDNIISDGRYDYEYHDVYLFAWTEYGSDATADPSQPEYNVEGSDAPTRQAELLGTFNVGQLNE